MGDFLLRQDNKITTSRYDLSVIEKRVMYFILKTIRQQFVLVDGGQRDLFDDLIVTMDSKKLVKEVMPDNSKNVRKALKALRNRSFEYDNGEVEDSDSYSWFEVGFINYGQWEKGKVEVQISKKILPFYVELTSRYTEYSLVVAMSLKSKWSQRMYELCAQWRSAGGFNISVQALRETFKLEDKYERYGAFKNKVLDVAQKELKELYDKGECDLYFNFSGVEGDRNPENLRFKIVVKTNVDSISLQDKDYTLRVELNSLFMTEKMPKNKLFIQELIAYLRLNPDELDRCYKKMLFVRQSIPDAEQAKYMRFVINEEFLKTKD